MTCTEPQLSVEDRAAGDTALSVIDSFFSDVYDFDYANQRLHKCMRSAFAEKSRFGKRGMMNLLFFVDMFSRVIDAAERLVKEPGSRKTGAVITTDDKTALLDPALYCSNMILQYQGESGAWDCFPRHLTQAEYLDPYVALEKCFARKSSVEWKDWLMEMLYASARNDSHVGDSCADNDIYKSIQCIFKLLEACHLVYVREMDK